MTTQKQSGPLRLQLGTTRASVEELAYRVEYLLERTLTGKEHEFLVLASELLKGQGNRLFKTKAGAA